MNNQYIDRICLGDCREHLALLEKESIDLFLSDIPYGISLDDWDVLHSNTNSALLGASPAQQGKTAFKRRGKPINGWSEADRLMPLEYQNWCNSWSALLYPLMKEGASLFVFGARRTIHRVIISFEDNGFILKDVIVWKKPAAHHRAQKLSSIFEKRLLKEEAEKWKGWRLGNLAPAYEPIAWFFKPYKKTITDNILKNNLGGMNIEAVKKLGVSPTNVLEYRFQAGEKRFHEAQKPEDLMSFFIQLTTIEGQTVLDPFMGSGTTAVCAKKMDRHFIGFEMNKDYVVIAENRLKKI